MHILKAIGVLFLLSSGGFFLPAESTVSNQVNESQRTR